MSDQERSPLENAALALYYHVAQMIKAGKSREDIITELVRQGVNRETAESMLDRLDKSRAKVARQNGYRNAFIGIVVTTMGLLPIAGILVPRAEGGTLFAAVIILGCGVFALGRGLMQITGL